jgi:uncharacterized protein
VSDDQRCAEARRIQRIDDAFKVGDIDALRDALEDPATLIAGDIHPAIGTSLVYAIYHSPLALIRALLDAGADPNAPVDDGFPPLIAALSCARVAPGVKTRTDVCDVVALLLGHGADPNQRGINDYTPLHMAVAERQPSAARLLLAAGADPALRTRIDEYETAEDMARAAGLTALADLLVGRRA